MKCLHLNCRLDAWTKGELRSHWCLEHAWRYVRGDIVPNDAQRARLEQFTDALRAPVGIHFPLEFIEHRRRRELRVAPWGSRVNICYDCIKPIVSGRKYCGRCRIRHGLNDDESEPLIQCDNWGKSRPGRYLNSECMQRLPARITKQPSNSAFRYCPPCFLKLDRMGAGWRKREGFDW